jgi:hypothetical protein
MHRGSYSMTQLFEPGMVVDRLNANFCVAHSVVKDSGRSQSEDLTESTTISHGNAVSADEVEAVREMLPTIKGLKKSVSGEIWRRAASSGSPEMLQLAIDDNNIDFQNIYKYLFKEKT